eukprot:CAMPEP_0197437900 /NCGR_PEP_ID=MMETSP1175-20131217/5032_1 /TAXON_ID=1003142 /ORGANISM="Triceratium dubium, Strain CCMP147" /LENGTH=208 /DNA_ID=CAMNT_0042967527 /DNA_START=126 /DNA_END=752 /DNA_ORIENTATION=+
MTAAHCRRRLALLLWAVLFLTAAPLPTLATVLIFYTDSNGVTHAEVRHDLDDCGFANVNPAVDCFPWFSISNGGGGGGGTGSGAVILNDAFVEPSDPRDYDDVDVAPPPKELDAPYDFYYVREECLLRGGTKLRISKINMELSHPAALTRFAAAASGCEEKFKVLSVPASTKQNNAVLVGKKAVKLKSTAITQQYGEILIDGVVFEVE